MSWYYAADNAQHGPLSLEEIKVLIADGTVGPSTLVWEKGMESWSLASKTELEPFLPVEAPPPFPLDAPPPLPVVAGDKKRGQPRIETIRLIKDAIAYSPSVYGQVLVFFVPSLVISFLTGLSTSEGSIGTTFLLFLVTYTCVFPYIGGASIFFVHQNLTRQGVTVADSMQKATERFSQLALTSVLLYASILAGSLCLILPGIYLSIRLSFVVYAVVIENRSATDALARSWMLTKGYWWQIFLTLSALFFPITVLGGLLGSITGGNFLVSSLLGGLAGMLMGPIIAIYYVFVFMSLVNLATRSSSPSKSSLHV
jgi:hypothetical protein